MKRCFLIVIILILLNSCGIGFFGIATENNIYMNDKSIKFEKNVCMPIDGVPLSFGCSKYLLEEKNENIFVSIDFNDININVGTFGSSKMKMLSFGVLPLIPAPPIIPIFFFPAVGHKEFCGGSNYKIELIFSNENSNLDNVEIDLNNIYLLKDNKKIYANGYTNELKTYKDSTVKKIFVINFPITCEETNNSLIFIKNIKINNQSINLPIGKIIYKSGWFFMMGYFANN